MASSPTRPDAAAAYNYARFRLEAYLDRDAMTPTHGAGDPAPDPTVSTLDGEPTPLSTLWATGPAVIEFGSITCPLFTHNVDPMERLAARYGDRASFAVLYVREAHPGGRYGAHASLADKLAAARDCVDAEGIEHRRVLVDDVDGTAHRALGAFPNSTYLVGTDGVVAFRADWTDPDPVADHLERLLDADGRGAAVAPVSVEDNYRDWRAPGKIREGLRVFRRAGLSSLIDFATQFPRILRSRR